MNYFLIQPYFKLFYPFKSVRFLNFSLFNFIFAKKKQLTFLLLALSLLLGIIYVLEFNLVLNLGKNIAVLNMELKKTINDFDKNDANYSKVYATAISSYLEEAKILERVSKIEYVEKESLVEAAQYIP